MAGGKWVYFFGNGKADGRPGMKDILGGKGSGLAEMTRLGVPVPPGFTISTEVCALYSAPDGPRPIAAADIQKRFPADLPKAVQTALRKVERVMQRTFGDASNPLLVSVRSGARISMPGMMDTVLNLGLNDATVEGLAAMTGSERSAYDSYRRFIQMYANVVLGMDGAILEGMLEDAKEEKQVANDTELTASDLKSLIDDFKKMVRAQTDHDFPEDPQDQLWGAIAAVFDSWDTPRAKAYRRINRIPEEWGTAVNVQSMVFGNMGGKSATGVAFTRDPSTGEKKFFGEFLPNAQGEDVVAGIRTPRPITAAGAKKKAAESLEKTHPKAYRELVRVYKKLEKYYRDMQDIEFTIENGKLWMLQTRTGKRTARAAVRIAVEMEKERLISKEEAVMRVEPAQLDQLLHPTIDPKAPKTFLAKGLPASPGAVSGHVVFSADEAEQRIREKTVLVRTETSPDDIHGMHSAQGILTARGGMTSHAAVVARGMGKTCVAGCEAVVVDYESKFFRVGDTVVRHNDIITLDGTTGEVYLGEIPTTEPKLDKEFQTLMGWADKVRTMGVRANADTPDDAEVARKFGAEGIGLCRTEHMFFEADRITAMREMILATDEVGRRRALDKILPIQREDFIGIFRAMKGAPITIRLLDPPLHEFLPHTPSEIKGLSRSMSVPEDRLRATVDALTEFNPMLGHRGCRLGITYPEIYEMQTRAIMEAAVTARKKYRTKVHPEIMIPLVGHVEELRFVRERVEAVCAEVLADAKTTLEYHVGTMIELPRAAVTAGDIAEAADFFSFGTNDLTQTTYGLSRDDAGRFLPKYVEKGILPEDPFVSLDQPGVGALMQLGVERGRATRPDLTVGICGEHGGDPASVEFCFRAGLDYVSCSPYRVPIARLAAGRAAIAGGAKVAPQKASRTTAAKKSAGKKTAARKTRRKK